MAEFVVDLVHHILSSRREAISIPNIDPWRFPEIQAPDGYNSDVLLEYLELFMQHRSQLNHVSDLFFDNYSRYLLKCLYTFRALGPQHVVLPTNIPGYWQKFEIGGTWRQVVSDKVFSPFEFALYHAEFLGQKIELECWLGNVVLTYLIMQYFLDRRGVLVQPDQGDYVIDAGGCFGDTALAFSAAVGETGRVFSFEPIPSLREVFKENMSRNRRLAANVELYDNAVSETDGETLSFGDFGAGSHADTAGAIPVTTATIDEFVAANGLARLDFIKMDIEGAERQALRGAVKTIRKFKPKLAISAYHRPDDLIEIPLLIKEIEPSYELILDHYTIHIEESVVFATT